MAAVRDLVALMRRVLEQDGRGTRGALGLRPRRQRERNQERNRRRNARVARARVYIAKAPEVRKGKAHRAWRSAVLSSEGRRTATEARNA